MTTVAYFLKNVHPSWKDYLENALAQMDVNYLTSLYHSTEWLPGKDAIFNAFSIPVHRVNYVLFGESPYPRRESANGYAFWDAAVDNIWSDTGFSKKVNRATSLRNLFKMLLVAEGALSANHTSQEDIARLDKKFFVQTNTEFFGNLLNKGFLLLNATPVLSPANPKQEAKKWHPFIESLLKKLFKEQNHIIYILFGQIAQLIFEFMPDTSIKTLQAEHPYNHSFIHNQQVLDFFKPLHLLVKKKK